MLFASSALLTDRPQLSKQPAKQPAAKQWMDASMPHSATGLLLCYTLLLSSCQMLLDTNAMQQVNMAYTHAHRCRF